MTSKSQEAWWLQTGPLSWPKFWLLTRDGTTCTAFSHLLYEHQWQKQLSARGAGIQWARRHLHRYDGYNYLGKTKTWVRTSLLLIITQTLLLLVVEDFRKWSKSRGEHCMLSARRAPDWAVSLDQLEDQGQGQAHAAARSSGSPGAAGRKRGAVPGLRPRQRRPRLLGAGAVAPRSGRAPRQVPEIGPHPLGGPRRRAGPRPARAQRKPPRLAPAQPPSEGKLLLNPEECGAAAAAAAAAAGGSGWRSTKAAGRGPRWGGARHAGPDVNRGCPGASSRPHGRWRVTTTRTGGAAWG